MGSSKYLFFIIEKYESNFYIILIQDDTGSNSKCYVLTIHDIGCSRMLKSVCIDYFKK